MGIDVSERTLELYERVRESAAVPRNLDDILAQAGLLSEGDVVTEHGMRHSRYIFVYEEEDGNDECRRFVPIATQVGLAQVVIQEKPEEEIPDKDRWVIEALKSALNRYQAAVVGVLRSAEKSWTVFLRTSLGYFRVILQEATLPNQPKPA